jgi:acetyl-CoA carboxylase biotin carboxyl carrier protein
MNGKKKGGKVKALAAATPAKTAKAKVGAGGGGELDLVRELAEIIGEYGLSEIEIDPSGRVRVRRELGGGGFVAAPVTSAPSPISLAPAPPVEAPAEAGTYVTSPFVGTFYRSPSPEAAAFVDVGAPVRKGQVVCIVEAMKLMNEIESEADGKIAEILVKNGEHVEYGQKLFRVA